MNKKFLSQHLLDLSKNTKYIGKIKKFNIKKELFNPLCGDKIVLYMLVKKRKIVDVSFESDGCMISKVGALVSLDMIKGENIEFLKTIEFNDILDSIGIKDMTESRKKCAVLAFEGLKSINFKHL